MEIALPTGGQCVVLSSQTTLYNYLNNRTRDVYYLIDGKAVRSRTETNQYNNYDWSGYQCLHAGDLVYKPEINQYFEFMSIVLIIFVFILIYKITLGRWIK